MGPGLGARTIIRMTFHKRKVSIKNKAYSWVSSFRSLCSPTRNIVLFRLIVTVFKVVVLIVILLCVILPDVAAPWLMITLDMEIDKAFLLVADTKTNNYLLTLMNRNRGSPSKSFNQETIFRFISSEGKSDKASLSITPWVCIHETTVVIKPSWHC